MTEHLPAAPGLSQPFWDGCEVSELRFQRCGCGHAQFPPAEHCRQCLSRDLTWEVASGTGRLYSWTVVHRPPSPAFEVPYAPVIVEADEGFLFLSHVIRAPLEDLAVGMAVRIRFTTVNGRTLPCVEPA